MAHSSAAPPALTTEYTSVFAIQRAYTPPSNVKVSLMFDSREKLSLNQSPKVEKRSAVVLVGGTAGAEQEPEGGEGVGGRLGRGDEEPEQREQEVQQDGNHTEGQHVAAP